MKSLSPGQSEHSPTPWKVRTDIGNFIQASPAAGERYGEAVTNNGGIAKPKTIGAANAAHIVRCVNSHEALVEALINARILVRALTGDLTKRSKFDADAGFVDAVAWTCQQQIEAALALALEKK